MNSPDLADHIRALREEGRSIKQIAKALGVRPSTVAPLVNEIIAEDHPDVAEREIAGCWINPGWSDGLTVPPRPDWPDGEPADPGVSGLVGILLARREGRDQVRMCGYLLDVHCLGVKNLIGPRTLDSDDLPEMSSTFFSAFSADPISVPIDLARELVHGSVAYARSLGFTPAPGFRAAAELLGPASGPSVIGFGRDGKPTYVEGPHDDAKAVIRTLDRTVGQGNYDFIVALG